MYECWKKRGVLSSEWLPRPMNLLTVILVCKILVPTLGALVASVETFISI
jgi:hypothetical protein